MEQNERRQLSELSKALRALAQRDGSLWEHMNRSVLTPELAELADAVEEALAASRSDAEEQQHRAASLEERSNELRTALEHAQRENRAKALFLNNMSHDIRTPMNAILGFTALASTHLEDTESVREYLKKIMTSSNHLLSLINDVLDMSRIESGRVKIEEKACSLPDILHDLKTIVQADINAKQLEFFIDTMDVVNEEVYCDKLRLNQVLLNVLSNAMKFTPPGGVVSVRIAQLTTAPEGFADYVFRIRDTGAGMSEEALQNIFVPFGSEGMAEDAGTQGTGLGMAITKNIVDMMHGTIAVESEVGKGTEFTISLRFRVSGSGHGSEQIPELAGLRVLVADDDYNTCASVTRMLQRAGMRSDWTSSGKEAVLRSKLAMESGDAFRAYIIDWLMPDMNGIEAARRIRKQVGMGPPIIILTAYDWSDVEEEAQEAGVTAFCSKPLFLSELRDTLLRACGFASEEKEAQEETDFSGRRILLVEDNEINLEIAEAILSEAGFELDTARDGAAAVEKVRASVPGQYDLILMDVEMPIMSGYEAAQKIRALETEHARIPIIAMTGNVYEEDRRRAMAAGMDGHVIKPIETDRLLAALRNALR